MEVIFVVFFLLELPGTHIIDTFFKIITIICIFAYLLNRIKKQLGVYTLKFCVTLPRFIVTFGVCWLVFVNSIQT